MSQIVERPRAATPAEVAMRLHPYYRGKVQVLPKCPVTDLRDFAVWYTPGVAAPCLAIRDDPDLVFEHTNKGNSVAIVTDGTRILGLGPIGPEAGLPVMEGKSLLFKYLGGVDAVPICLDTVDPDEIVRTTLLLQPAFGGVNLEDIEQPKCFRVLDALRRQARIPVWHDDQQGSATVALAGLLNALEVVGKRLTDVRITLVGMGAANVATFRLLLAMGVSPGAVVACDSRGILHPARRDVEVARERFPDKWRACTTTNADLVTGGVAEALRGADVCIAFSRPGPGTIDPAWISGMAHDAIVFACANPVPEIWPDDAKAAGARIVGTGCGDLPNQVNNSLGFPGIFRGVLDVRARTITDSMALAAARALADFAAERGLREDAIVPTMADWEVYPRVATATAKAAHDEGLAACWPGEEAELARATRIISEAREATRVLMATGCIPPFPADGATDGAGSECDD
jgi:malate dehydrogenase (oxaloacetate-decarboxylating)